MSSTLSLGLCLGFCSPAGNSNTGHINYLSVTVIKHMTKSTYGCICLDSQLQRGESPRWVGMGTSMLTSYTPRPMQKEQTGRQRRQGFVLLSKPAPFSQADSPKAPQTDPPTRGQVSNARGCGGHFSFHPTHSLKPCHYKLLAVVRSKPG